MDSQFWAHLGIFLHIVGIVPLSAGAIGTIITDNAVWSNLKSSPTQAAAAARMGKRFSLFAQGGLFILLLSGILLLAARNWFYLGEVWLIIKLVLFGLMLLNGVLVARSTTNLLLELLPNWLAVNGATPSLIVASAVQRGQPLPEPKYNRVTLELMFEQVRRRFELFYISQNIMFAVVLVLATFKFN